MNVLCATRDWAFLRPLGLRICARDQMDGCGSQFNLPISLSGPKAVHVTSLRYMVITVLWCHCCQSLCLFINTASSQCGKRPRWGLTAVWEAATLRACTGQTDQWVRVTARASAVTRPPGYCPQACFQKYLPVLPRCLAQYLKRGQKGRHKGKLTFSGTCVEFQLARAFTDSPLEWCFIF